jgi:aryl-alcohol dehydrogenase-like predicted oxidoreductase
MLRRRRGGGCSACSLAGGNVIDTADVYTNGSSETILGELLKGRRDRFVLATKFARVRRRRRLRRQLGDIDDRRAQVVRRTATVETTLSLRS